MLEKIGVDIIEDDTLAYEQKLLQILLFDRSSRKNIIWATGDYEYLGDAYRSDAEILPELITKEHTLLIQPRISKATEEQESRTRDKAEVFTPAWICNRQNNLVDEAWFGHKDIFNQEDGTTWHTIDSKIVFPSKGSKTWNRYVDAKRLEISCGEAPYLVTRYDAVAGEEIPIHDRVGLLDRKLRVVGENTTTEEEWTTWAIRAVQSVYGYEYQGDNLLLARENVFISFLDYYRDRFGALPPKKIMEKVALIISWNIWQMDGTKYVVPMSCKPIIQEEGFLFAEDGFARTEEPCPGCKYGDHHKHTGLYCKVFDWRENASIPFISLIGGKKA